MLLCRYCETFYISPVVNEKGAVQRNCEVIEDNVKSSSKACRKFKPTSGFWCDQLNFRTCLEICINRRRNKKGYEAWNYCVKCRQYEQEVKSVVEKFMERKIKRREKPEDTHGWKAKKRVITRRQLQDIAKAEVRKIRRRN